MLRADFSDIQKNGFRISQFRLIHSPEMRPKNYNSSKEEYKSSGNIIGEKNLVIKYLIEQNEIDFTIYYFSERLMYLFITSTLLLFVFHNPGIALQIISALFSLIFYILAYRHKENFALGDLGINFAESIYKSEIKENYNFEIDH